MGLNKKKKRPCTHIKKNGKPCGNSALKGREKCRKHGAGGAPIKTGLHSRLLKGRLKAKIEAYMKDPKLTDMRETIATKRALLDELFETFLRSKKNKNKLNVATIDNAIKILSSVSADIEKLHKLENGTSVSISVNVLSQAIGVVVHILDKNIQDIKIKQRIFAQLKEFGLVSGNIT